jgi:CRISPR/Cas system-associated exonuclease Cas4 (RecB family)
MNLVKSNILKHNLENGFRFIEDEHKYYVGDQEYISVTTKLGKYFVFNKKKISREVAYRNWVTEEEVISDWDYRRDSGRYIHELANKYLENKDLKTDELNLILHVIDFIKEHPEFEIVASELGIFSKKYAIAGTIDLILKDKHTNKLYTLDWKTSRKSIAKNEYFTMARDPFTYLPNSKLYLYSMQLWAYNLILAEEYGIEIWDSIIVHLQDNSKYIKIVSRDLRTEAKHFLEI